MSGVKSVFQKLRIESQYLLADMVFSISRLFMEHNISIML